MYYLCTYYQMKNQKLLPHIHTSQLLNIFACLSFVLCQQLIKLIRTNSFFDGRAYS
jgi:hypothetical protein